MIKSLLNADEEPLPKTEQIDEEKFFDSTNKDVSEKTETENQFKAEASRNVFEIPEEARFFAKPTEIPTETDQTPISSEPETQPETLTNDAFKDEFPTLEIPPIVDEKPVESFQAEPEKIEPPNVETSQPTIFQTDYSPETPGETVRNSSLAYSAAIVLFASIVFMMMLGWFIGQLIGNSTGGIVGGIIFGAIIGFVQFFRITSSIFKK